MRFEGEQKSEKYSEPLNAALDSWMHGENMDVPVAEWFDFKMPSPTIGHKYIKKMIDAYERDRDESYRKEMTERDRFLWLGGKVVVNGSRLIWHFMGEEIECESEKQNAGKLAELLNEIKPEKESALGEEMQKRIREVCAVCGEKVFVILRSAGLCRI